MPALPPLRTAREAAAVKADATVTPVPSFSRPGVPALTTPMPGLAGPSNAPHALRLLLGKILQADLVDSATLEEFVTKLGPRLANLTDRDRAANALAMNGVITPFMAERLVQGNTFGLVFGNYRVQDRVNAGTVGTVFRAVHKVLKRTVAIKVVPSDDTVPLPFLERFDREMELLAAIQHPNVIGIYDTGTLTPDEPGLPPLKYAILEYVDGGDLENYVYAHGVVPVGQACEWGRQLAAGLAAAHAKNLVHRDFKPSNVLLTADRRAKVSDLGLARHFASISTPRPGIVGSIEFMPPEQVADAGTVESPADVYALGATLFWCLTGQLPYEKTTSTKEMLHAIRTTEPRLLRELNPDLPEELEAILARMMHRNPAERPVMREAEMLLASFADATAHPALQGTSIADGAESQLDLLRNANIFLEECLATRSSVAADSAAAVLTTLARVAQFRGEPAGLQKRIQEYVRVMARGLCRKPDWNHFQDPAILDDVIRIIPARNVGLVGVPDQVLTTTGELTREDQAALERHALIGCHILDVVVARHGRSLPFARLARDVIRSHHEKWDGSGFPDRLRHEAIPHAARLVAMAEAYDALRQPLGQEPGLTHEQAIEGLVNDSKGFFDPAVLDALVASHAAIAHVFASIPD